MIQQKAYGQIPGKTKTGLELKRGKSKDHRPDLNPIPVNENDILR